MAGRREKCRGDELDGLRLLALGRIPRCGSCPRYAALTDAHARGTGVRGTLPGVPESCTHQVCAPLVVRFLAGHGEEAPREEEILHLRAS
jgi:hypothetical protein